MSADRAKRIYESLDTLAAALPENEVEQLEALTEDIRTAPTRRASHRTPQVAPHQDRRVERDMEQSAALSKVRGLLAKADDPATTPEESATYRAKAEELIAKYRIEQGEALAQDPQSLAPEWQEIEIADAGEFSQEQLTLFHYIAAHVGVRYRAFWGGGTLRATAVGFSFDLRLLELIYTNARMAFSERLTPSYDPNLSEAENIYRLRSAGIVRTEVAKAIWGHENHQLGLKVGRIYKEECARRGEAAALDGRGVSAKNFRTVYAREFAYALEARLRRAREGVDSTGGTVVLAGRAERVDEAFYERYPERRPTEEPATSEPCPTCAKRKDGTKCRDCRPRRATKAQLARSHKLYGSAEALAGAAAARRAAEAVDLDGSPNARRLDDRGADERTDARSIAGILDGR